MGRKKLEKKIDEIADEIVDEVGTDLTEKEIDEISEQVEDSVEKEIKERKEVKKVYYFLRLKKKHPHGFMYFHGFEVTPVGTYCEFDPVIEKVLKMGGPSFWFEVKKITKKEFESK